MTPKNPQPQNSAKQQKLPSKLTLLFIAFLLFQFASPHGTVVSPVSRVYNCFLENPENPSSAPCIAAAAEFGAQPFYDWNEINQGQANGQHTLFVPDGNLGSGGRPDKYGGMDQVRSDWVTTPVVPGPFEVKWLNTAPHATAYYEVYITKESWGPDQPLTWDDLELLVRTEPSPAESEVNIPVTLPNRTGKHIIYSVWQRSDSPEAFYSTSDVDFGGNTLGTDTFESTLIKFKAYPNPFSDNTKINYTLTNEALVQLTVYDILGKKISTLVNKKQSAGDYDITFNGSNLNKGMYFCVFKIGNYSETIKVILK